MTQYNTLDLKLSNSHLNKLNSGIKNKTEVALKLSSNIINDSSNDDNFHKFRNSHKLLLTNTQVSKLCKAFTNNSSANKKLSKARLHKIVRWGGRLGRLLGLLLKIGLSLIGDVLKPLPKNVLIPLGSRAAASATDAAIHEKMFGSGATTLIISIEEMNHIMKIVKSLEESGLLIKGVNETFKNELKEQIDIFPGMLLDTLGG